MSGDINFNLKFKINKKIGLAILGGMSLFAMADFVTLIDAKSAGGITIEKETMTVGSVVFRMDDVNPSTIYGGTWELLKGDATIALGDGTVQSGVSSGDNDPQVPLVEHSHTRGTMEISGRVLNYTSNKSKAEGSSPNGAFYGTGSIQYDGGGSSSGNHQYPDNIYFQASRNWTGSTSVEGVSNATLNVRGERLTVNVWQRIN